MAVPASFDESNLVLSRPAELTDEQCEALAVFWGTEAGRPIVISCWKFTADELQEINRTGRVWLGLISAIVPPAWISGLKPNFPESE